MGRIAALVGAVGANLLSLYVGRGAGWLLRILFMGWVTMPFATAVVLKERAFDYLMVTLAIGSLAIYGYVAFGPPRPQPAFWFLVVPLASWALIGAVRRV